MFQNAAKAQAVHRDIGGEHTSGLKILPAPDPKDIVGGKTDRKRIESSSLTLISPFSSCLPLSDLE